MSQRLIKLQFPALGRPVEIMVGFDRPLGHFFMVILDGAADDELVYSNLEDPEAGFPRTLSRYQVVLKEMGLEMPEQVWADVLEDQRNNAGNLQAWYDKTGRAISEDEF